MLFSQFAAITSPLSVHLRKDRAIDALVTDSRKPVVSETSVFFAIKGERHDGHRYLHELYNLGMRQFVIELEMDTAAFPEANFLRVSSSLRALQQLAAHHRQQFAIPVVGITGSNGKTTIKEWLHQILSLDCRVVKSPGSYNSQLGVPLSVWGLNETHNLAVFEAGISTTGEMEKLEPIIRPTVGIFTNLGTAHNEGFYSMREKADEKAKLFSRASTTIYCKDHELIDEALRRAEIRTLCWGFSPDADIQIERMGTSHFRVTGLKNDFELDLPFQDPAMQENAFHVVAFLLMRGYVPVTIQERINHLHAVPMRLELKQGVHRSLLIDDSYNNDLAGLKISLDFLRTQQKKIKW